MTAARAALLAAVAWLAAGAAAAQAPLRVSSAVAPETVTVGDRFRTVLQLVVPAGAAVEFPDLPVRDTLQPVDSVRVVPGRAGEPPIAVYSLVAWVAGAPLRAEAPVRVVRADGGSATYLVPLRLPVVRSVLPADTAGVRPRPAHGVLPLAADRGWPWPWLLLALLVLAAGAAAAAFLARRGDPAAAAPGTPRERAIAALDRVERERRPGDEAGDLYPAVTRVLRGYLAEVSPACGLDLTTGEVMARLAVGGPAARERLGVLLHHADRVKFARYAPAEVEVRRFLAGARAWVLDYPPQVAAPAPREAA